MVYDRYLGSRAAEAASEAAFEDVGELEIVLGVTIRGLDGQGVTPVFLECAVGQEWDESARLSHRRPENSPYATVSAHSSLFLRT